MHNASCSGTKLQGANPFAFRQVQRQHEIPIDVLALGRDFKRLRHLHNEVGLPELPALGELRRHRQLRPVAFLHALLMPRAEQRDLVVGQAAFIAEFHVAVLRVPRRHECLRRHFRDLFAALLGVLEILERERRSLAGTMAVRAVLKQNRRNVLGEGHVLRKRFQITSYGVESAVRSEDCGRGEKGSGEGSVGQVHGASYLRSGFDEWSSGI